MVQKFTDIVRNKVSVLPEEQVADGIANFTREIITGFSKQIGLNPARFRNDERSIN